MGDGRAHPARAPGFTAAPDPFASISQNRSGDDDDEAIDFEDTYDGLGDHLDEADDDLNDDTFGGGGIGNKTPARDFDFFGSTNKVSNAINEEAVRFQRQHTSMPQPASTSQVPAPSFKPYRSGYEPYKKPGFIPDLQVDPSLWTSNSTAIAPKNADEMLPQHQKSGNAPQKKMMSLEEVEAAMRARKPSPASAIQQPSQGPCSKPSAVHTEQPFPLRVQDPTKTSQPNTVHILQPSHDQPSRTQDKPSVPPVMLQQRPIEQSFRHGHQPSRSTQLLMPSTEDPGGFTTAQILQRQTSVPQRANDSSESHPPRQILQNPNRHSGHFNQSSMNTQPPGDRPAYIREPPPTESQMPLPIITHPSQLAALTDEQRRTLMAEEAKRAKRNHKIYLLSKGNGLMTPQDKNFITRIQLQQLMTATGDIHDSSSDTALSEDFYYQVYNQIENRPRQHPNQPLSNFAQTYLFQTGSRQGGMNRRHNRGDNHMHRMQQQVQRAVEAAKAKPKNKQLVIEGSLGKISFSNAKTPKPLLNIKKNDKIPQATLSATDRKAILKNIESVYSSLMAIEDHDRQTPPEVGNESDPTRAEALAQWRQVFTALKQRLWSELKVMEPIIPDSPVMHPFIAFLSYPKGKKAIPRVFSHVDQEQRLTILTIIMVQLDSLDVIRSVQPQLAAKQSPSVAREQVDLFLQTVMPSLFSYVTEAPLSIIIGLIGLVIERVNVSAVVRSRVGLEILTMLLSQAEIIRKAEATNQGEWEQWLGVYNRLFNTVEPLLAIIFPESVSVSQDVYVWQFLATVGTGANPEQQQRLVLAVK